MIKTPLRAIDNIVSPRLGTQIWGLDGDMICILDACRFDTFTRFLPAKPYYSVASSSQTWIKRTFDRDNLDSIGYISGNPYSHQLNEDDFGYFHLEGVQKTEYGIETVPPDALTDRAIKVWNERDMDRLVVHYMQPHVPFRSHPEWFDEFADTDTWGSSKWSKIGDKYNRFKWLNAYRDNLAWVLEDIERYRNHVDATVAVTSDHANLAGEFGLYGHPTHVPIPTLRRVPYHRFEATKTQGFDEEIDATPVDPDRQLRALGYK